MVANLLYLLGGHSTSAHRQADEGLVLVGGAFPGVGKETHPVGLETSGGPHFAAVDDKIIRAYSERYVSSHVTTKLIFMHTFYV